MDWPWALHFKPTFLPREIDFELTPRIIAKLPLLGASGFKFAKNTAISNTVRLECPRLDMPSWRQRAQAAGTPRVSNFFWSDNHSLLGPVPEDGLISVSQVGSPSSRARVRSPPKNNRHMQAHSASSLPPPPRFKQPPVLKDEIRSQATSPQSLQDLPRSSHRSKREIEYFNYAPSSFCDKLKGCLPKFYLAFLRMVILDCFSL